ncbi:cyclodeaminase/cyclohydrolase family protein [Alloiococcus sp. CFN-8]|uniref:cyclodeaminase/cyclohydrolase family protein n=1 Tax=Alloiococcus sp. CFN-8 TaxID=3416081 RepID=UPI003CF6B8BF
MFKNVTINDFLQDLASNSPAPGGGSVAGLSSALAAALGSMVCNLTIPKKAFEKLSEEEKSTVHSSLEACKESIDKYIELMEEDTRSFMGVIEAYKLPKDTEEEVEARNKAVMEGYKVALETPKKLCDESLKLYPVLDSLADLGNKNAISDVGVAALMLYASIESALLNVIINLNSIDEIGYKDEINKYISAAKEKNEAMKNKIINKVNSKIS